jgi:hypothetical protein
MNHLMLSARRRRRQDTLKTPLVTEKTPAVGVESHLFISVTHLEEKREERDGEMIVLMPFSSF